MRKPNFCICDQLNCEADQLLCFRYTDSTILLNLKFPALAMFCACTAQCVSDLFQKPHCWISHDAAQFLFVPMCLDRLYLWY